jgi:DNA-binding IclR family transcriptional regulator
MHRKDDMRDRGEGRVASVERAFAILDCFQYGDKFLSLLEIAERTSLHKPTILRMLQTLIDLQYIGRASNGLYFIGPAALRLASLHSAAARNSDVITLELARLSQVIGETTSYSVRKGEFRIYIHRANASRRLRDNIQPGDISPVRKGATGRILLAFSDDADARYEKERSEMVAISNGEMETGMTGISSPVFGEQNKLAGAISVSGPEVRLQNRALQLATYELVRSAQAITIQMGGDPHALNAALQRLETMFASEHLRKQRKRRLQ